MMLIMDLRKCFFQINQLQFYVAIVFQFGSEEEYFFFEYYWRFVKISICDFFDDESSGVSSIDNSLDNVFKGMVVICLMMIQGCF